MKNKFTRKIKFLTLGTILALASTFSQGAELLNPSWSAGSLEAGDTTTYTFSYQIVTADPAFIIYAVFPFSEGFSGTGVSNCTVTVNGTLATIGLNSGSNSTAICLSLANPSLATAGSNIVVTAQVVNGSVSGSYNWYWIQTADGGGNAIDSWTSPPPLVITPPIPNVPVTTAATSLSAISFHANWNSDANASAYWLDVSTDNTFSSYVANGSNVNAGNALSYTVSGLSPATTYYYRVRASDTSGTSGNSNVMSVTTKGIASIIFGNLNTVYNDSSQQVTATTVPSGLTVDFTYNGSPILPTNVGSYTVIGTIVDSSYVGSDTATFVISKATLNVSLSNLTAVYNGSPAQATAIVSGNTGVAVGITYDASSTAPTNAGIYTVIGTISDINYQGSDTANLVISKANASVSLGNLNVPYTGAPQVVTSSTTPADLFVNISYDGYATPPTDIGTYTVIATILEQNYQGSDTSAMTIYIASGIAEYSLNDIKLYPNPATDFIVINSALALKSIRVIDLSGASVLVKENCSMEERLDVTSLSKGTYLVVLESASGKVCYPLVIN